jgi:mono/diheme cytochrome c family protein
MTLSFEMCREQALCPDVVRIALYQTLAAQARPSSSRELFRSAVKSFAPVARCRASALPNQSGLAWHVGCVQPEMEGHVGATDCQAVFREERWVKIVSACVGPARRADHAEEIVVNSIGKAFLILLIFLWTTDTALGQDKAAIERGMKVYADQKCSVCHSIGGKGNPKGVLDDVGSRLTIEEIRLWMVNPAEMTKKTKAERKPPMRAYPNLSKEDLDALVAYMASLKK